jgi:hypothetical protein
MPEIMQADLAEAGVRHYGQKISVIQVVWVEDLSRSSISILLSSRDRSTRRLFLLFVVVCSRRT